MYRASWKPEELVRAKDPLVSEKTTFGYPQPIPFSHHRRLQSYSLKKMNQSITSAVGNTEHNGENI